MLCSVMCSIYIYMYIYIHIRWIYFFFYRKFTLVLPNRNRLVEPQSLATKNGETHGAPNHEIGVMSKLRAKEHASTGCKFCCKYSFSFHDFAVRFRCRSRSVMHSIHADLVWHMEFMLYFGHIFPDGSPKANRFEDVDKFTLW